MMFPYLVDGKWSATPAPKEQPAAVEPKRRREWVKRGFFKHHKPMPRREVATRANNARMWLEYVLHAGPKPATEILRLAQQDGVPQRAVRRAKRFHKIVSLRVGGIAWRGKWVWQFPQA